MTLKEKKVRVHIIPVKESPRALVGLHTPEVSPDGPRRTPSGDEEALRRPNG